MPKVKFIQEKVEIEAPSGANLRTEAKKAGIELYEGPDKYFNCLGNGMCGACAVHLKNGTAKNVQPMGAFEKVRTTLGFFAIGHEDECRLACQTKITGDIEVWTRPGFNWFGETIKETAPAAKPAAPAPVAAAAPPAPPKAQIPT